MSPSNDQLHRQKDPASHQVAPQRASHAPGRTAATGYSTACIQRAIGRSAGCFGTRASNSLEKAASITEKDIAFWLMAEILRLGFPGESDVCLVYDGEIAHRYGQGRGRKGYAERIGKKYSWIALHRLIALLSANLAPAKDWTGKAPGHGALAYSLRLRKADFTDVRDIRPRPAYPDELLPSSEYAFPTDGDDRNWLDRQDLTPHGECLIRTDGNGTEWFALSLSAESDETPMVDEEDAPYRRITLDYWTVLAPAALGFDMQRDEIEDALHRNAPNSYRAYFAEYPSESAFEHCLNYGELSLGENQVIHTRVTLSRGGEWEYDYSWRERAEHLEVPTKVLVEKLHLHWDQHSGWLDEGGQLAAFNVIKDKRSALFLRKALLDKYLLDESQVVYARQFVYRGKIGGFSNGGTPALDVNTVLAYSPSQGLLKLDEKRELFEPDC